MSSPLTIVRQRRIPALSPTSFWTADANGQCARARQYSFDGCIDFLHERAGVLVEGPSVCAVDKSGLSRHKTEAGKNPNQTCHGAVQVDDVRVQCPDDPENKERKDNYSPKGPSASVNKRHFFGDQRGRLRQKKCQLLDLLCRSLESGDGSKIRLYATPQRLRNVDYSQSLGHMSLCILLTRLRLSFATAPMSIGCIVESLAVTEVTQQVEKITWYSST